MLEHALIFPKLGLAFNINRIAFSVCGLDIYWYGVLMSVSFIFCTLIILLRAKTFGIDDDFAVSSIIFAILVGIVGARLYYVVFNIKEINKFWHVFDLRRGGMAIYGGLIFGSVVLWAFAKAKKRPILPVFDLFASAVPLGQAIGRWGNFLNMEAFGTNTHLPWGMTSAQIKSALEEMKADGMAVDPSIPVHPCFLYESIWCLLGLILITVFIKHRRFNGEILSIYVMWYSFGRFFIEALRTDSVTFAGVRASQVLSGLLFFSCLFCRKMMAQHSYASINTSE
ncbi:MAG: prolipoprotein diacylglyceryl transferase [Oscillospiraceae bacterium]|nr:prolipoprotein diacylglyceryl transferase [Oscillospiraceae bacterium]